MNPSGVLAERFARIRGSAATPRFHFFPDILQQRLEEVSRITAPESVFYSLKANPHPLVLKQIASAGFSADVASLPELRLALAAGFAPSRLSCVGPWKSPQFLRAATEAGVRRVCFENTREFNWLHSRRNKGSPELFGRLLFTSDNLGVVEQMATAVSPFGLTAEELGELSGDLRDTDGIHVYAGSDIQTVAGTVSSLAGLSNLNTSWPTSRVQYGPGLGISYDPGVPDIPWAHVVEASSREAGERILFYEMGRYLVAHCAALLTSVQIIKKRSGKTVCVLDTGITSFARTAITSATHAIIRIGHPIEAQNDTVVLCGPTCTPLDRIRGACYFSEVREGDTLAILSAGAYGVNLNFSGFLGFKRAPFLSASTAA